MLNSLYPTHLFQFADGAAVITDLEHEDQVLLNYFTRWCKWAGVKIRVDKCITYGIKKATTSVQFLPKLTRTILWFLRLRVANLSNNSGAISILVWIIITTCQSFYAQLTI